MVNFGGIEIDEKQIVHRTRHSVVFTNIMPFLPHHVLVIPLSRKTRLVDLREDELIDLTLLVQRTVAVLGNFGTSTTVVCQDGKDAGQTIEHVHFHLIPRNPGDLRNNNEIYSEKSLSLDSDRPPLTLDEMAEEAKLLSKFF